MSSPHKLLISSNYSTVKTQNHLVMSLQSTNQCHPNSHTQLLTLHGAVSAEPRDHKTTLIKPNIKYFIATAAHAGLEIDINRLLYASYTFILPKDMFPTTKSFPSQDKIVEVLCSALERPHFGNSCSCGRRNYMAAKQRNL